MEKAIEQQIQAVNGSSRSIKPFLGPVLGRIEHYGCWCYFDNDNGLGKGVAQNELDEYCRTLHEGYECAIMDGEEASEPCVPWEVDYLGASASTPREQIYDVCAMINSNNCAVHACAIESLFVVEIFQ